MAEDELNKEGSVFFQSFMDQLKAQREAYKKEKAVR